MSGNRTPDIFPWILLADPDPKPYRKGFRPYFRGWRFTLEPDPQKAADFFFHHEIDLVLLGHSSPFPCLDLLNFFQTLKPSVPVIVLTDEGSEELVLSVFRGGAWDYFRKPFRPRALKSSMETALGSRQGAERRGKLVGISRAVRYISENFASHLRLSRIARESAMSLSSFERTFKKEMGTTYTKFLNRFRISKAAGMLEGESLSIGEVAFARAIHYLSPRAGKPFVPVSCGAIPVELMENELFGHAPGAYTGAAASQPGLAREAEGGTLFFDDMDCLSLMAQVKVLRLLQEKEYKPLGSNRFHQADVRLIAATNVDLHKAVEEGRFRQDLFYRVNIIPLALPPLRDRQEDIPLLAGHFLEKYASELKKEVKDLAPGALQKLLLHPWPGNVRELENVIERAVVFSRHPILQEADIQLPPSGWPALEPFKKAKIRAMEQFEKRYIQGLLLANQGNITHAARAADKNRRAFWELIRKYKIDARTYKPHPLGETG
jgi:DNA-binding NtrC family response regulator